MRILNRNIKKSLKVLTAIVVVAVSITSCSKDKDAGPAIIQVPTGVRLVHSSAISGTSLLDLYIDDAKVTPQAIAFSEASDYISATSGSKKVTVKTAAGTTVKDTILNVVEGHRYSIFVKEWQYGSSTTIISSPIKELIIADDSNTEAPDAGKAKVRFVNSATTGSSIFASSAPAATFLRVNPIGSVPATDYLTYNLTNTASDFLTVSPGTTTFSATAPNVAATVITVNMPETTLEAGKLYTVYLMGSPGGTIPGGAVVPSTMALKIIENN